MVRRKFIISITTLFFIVLNNISLLAFLREKQVKNGELIEKIEFGYINWTEGYIEISSKVFLPEIIKDNKYKIYKNENYATSLADARLIAFKQAKEYGKRNLLNAIYNLRIYNNYFIKSYLLKSTNDFKYRLDSFILSLTNYRKFYNNDNSITVKYKVKFFGNNGLFNIINNSDVNLIDFNKISIISNLKIISTNTNKLRDYSALILDCRKIKGLYPSLNFHIYDEKGNLIYGGEYISSNVFKEEGVVKYIGDTSYLEKIKFLDKDILIVKPLKKRRFSTSDIIISNNIAKIIKSSPLLLTNLKKGKVIVIIK